ncbi:unnamed protein product [Coregonus sp. 'balchen']|nr:unnamed protein product [Coregonus sp. 'balchen']
MILQAHEYEELEGKPGRLQEFFDSTQGRFHHPEVVQFVKSLNEERADHMAAGGDGSSGSSESKKPRTDSS